MTKWDKFRATLMEGRADKNIDFDDLITFLQRLEFTERVTGSHHTLSREGVSEIISLQTKSDGKAKPYQVKQVRAIIEQYGL